MSSIPHTRLFTECITTLSSKTGSDVTHTYSPVVSIEGNPISLVIAHKNDTALFYASLGTLPTCPFFALSVSTILLDAHVFLSETHGASLGVEQNSKIISLNQQFLLKNTTPAEFVTFAEGFTTLAAYWTQRLATLSLAFTSLPAWDNAAAQCHMTPPHSKEENTLYVNQQNQSKPLKTLFANDSTEPLTLLLAFLPPQAHDVIQATAFTPENLLSCVQSIQTLNAAEVASLHRHMASQEMTDTLHLLAQASEVAKASDCHHTEPLAMELEHNTRARYLYPLITRALPIALAMHSEAKPSCAMQKHLEQTITKPAPALALCWARPHATGLKKEFAANSMPTPIEALKTAFTGQKLNAAHFTQENDFVWAGIHTLLQQATSGKQVFAFLKEAAHQLRQPDSDINSGSELPFVDLLLDQEQYHEKINEIYQSIALQLFKDSRFLEIRDTLATAITLVTDILRPNILVQVHNTFERQTALQSAVTGTLSGFSSLLAKILCTLDEEEKYLLHNFAPSVQYGFVSDDAGPRDLLHFLTGFKEWEVMSTYPS